AGTPSLLSVCAHLGWCRQWGIMVRSYLRIARVALAIAGIVPLVVVLCSRWLMPRPPSSASFAMALAMAAVPLVLLPLILAALGRSAARSEAIALEQASHLDHLPARFVDLAIAGSAALSMFLELSLIRWQGTEFTIFTLYKNFG